MNYQIQDEEGGLHDFYPNAGTRAKILHGFAFLFLPQYVAQNPHAFFSYLLRKDQPGGVMDPTRFIQSRWTLFEEKAGIAPSGLETFKTGVVRSRRLTDLAMSLHEVDGQPAAVIQMPAPETAGLAYFVAVVLLAPAARPEEWPENARARIFALVRTRILQTSGQDTGVLCELTNAGHRAAGATIPIAQNTLLKAVEARLRESGPSAEMPYPDSAASMRDDSGEDVDEQQARAQLDAFFEGGDGSSAANAVRINMRRLADPSARQFMGVRLEYYWIERQWPGASVQCQRLQTEGGKTFDVMTVVFKSGEQREVWFEISTFLGRESTGQDANVVEFGGSTGSWALGLLLVLALGAALAWSSRTASGVGWFTSLGILGIGGGAVIWVKLANSFRRSKLFGGRLPLVFGLFWLCLMLEVVVVWGLFPGATVHVDNFSGRDVEIWIDGRRWADAAASSTQTKTLTRGAHAFEVRTPGNGQVLDAFTDSATSRGPYLFNTLGAQTYYEGRVEYAAPLARFGQPPKELVENENRARWQEVHVHYLFEVPPRSIEVSSTPGGAYDNRPRGRTYLLRESFVKTQKEQALRRRQIMDSPAYEHYRRYSRKTSNQAPASSGKAVAVRQTTVTATAPDPTVRLEAGLGNHLRADSERAVAEFKAGRVIEAELLVGRIVRDFDALMKEPAATYRCFRNASDRLQFVEANPNIGRLVWVDWRYTELLQFRAFVHVQRRQFEQALAVLDKSIRFGPDNATAHNERGYILAQSSRFEEALKAYEAAREASKRTGGSRIEEAAALRGIGGTWVDLGDLDKAEAALRESITLEPGNAVAQRELLFIHQLRAKPAQRNSQP